MFTMNMNTLFDKTIKTASYSYRNFYRNINKIINKKQNKLVLETPVVFMIAVLKVDKMSVNLLFLHFGLDILYIHAITGKSDFRNISAYLRMLQ